MFVDFGFYVGWFVIDFVCDRDIIVDYFFNLNWLQICRVDIVSICVGCGGYVIGVFYWYLGWCLRCEGDFWIWFDFVWKDNVGCMCRYCYDGKIICEQDIFKYLGFFFLFLFNYQVGYWFIDYYILWVS